MPRNIGGNRNKQLTEQENSAGTKVETNNEQLSEQGNSMYMELRVKLIMNNYQNKGTLPGTKDGTNNEQLPE